MAALRHMARRLGGCALQRAQALHQTAAVVSPHEQRLLSPAIFRGGGARPRPMSTSGPYGKSEFPGAKRATAEPDEVQKYVRSRMEQMHQVKEQLYDLEVEYERHNAANEPFLRRFEKARRLSRGWLVDVSLLVQPNRTNDNDRTWYRVRKRHRRIKESVWGMVGTLIFAKCVWDLHILRSEKQKQGV